LGADQYRPTTTNTFFFSSMTFEIISEDYNMEVINSTFQEVASEVAKRLNS
jgi:hypothetical protein